MNTALFFPEEEEAFVVCDNDRARLFKMCGDTSIRSEPTRAGCIVCQSRMAAKARGIWPALWEVQ